MRFHHYVKADFLNSYFLVLIELSQTYACKHLLGVISEVAA